MRISFHTLQLMWTCFHVPQYEYGRSLSPHRHIELIHALRCVTNACFVRFFQESRWKSGSGMLLTTSMIGLCWLLGISVLEKVTRNVKSDLKLLKRRCVYERIYQVASTGLRAVEAVFSSPPSLTRARALQESSVGRGWQASAGLVNTTPTFSVPVLL